jgi:phosphoserine phosphatase
VRTLIEAPRMLSLDMVDRGDFLRWFYRRYENADLATLRRDSWELTSDLLLAKSFPAGIRRVREHRALGHRTLLITGALDFVIEPFRTLFDDVVCAHMGQTGGRLSGEMVEAPPTGEARALIMADYARQHGLDLAECVVYADSPLLSTPRPSWPPWPASGAGSSNNGPGPPATGAPYCPSVPV